MKNNLFISFGGGVQTSALYLAYENGLIPGPKPVAAIFADTQAELPDTYEWIAHIQQYSSIPIKTVSRGSIIEETFKYNYVQAPVYSVGKGRKKGMGRRSCTYLFKILPVSNGLRSLTNTVRKKLPPKTFKLALGISTDEEGRRHSSRIKSIENVFPLLDVLRWDRNKCIEYVKKITESTPPRSACYMCPYYTNKEWVNLRDNNPVEWNKAMDYDEKIRNLKPERQNFLHADLVPLREAKIDSKEKQFSLFKTTCFGDCGT